MNNELLSLYEADKQERLNQPKVNTPEYNAMRGRDLERRERVVKIFAANELLIMAPPPAKVVINGCAAYAVKLLTVTVMG